MHIKTPCGIDLGDISALKVGDEVACIDPSGKRLAILGFSIVRHVESSRILTRKPDKDSIAGGFNPGTGKCFTAIYANPYYCSANPVHVAQGKKQVEANRLKREKEEAKKQAKIALCLPVGELLADEEAAIVAGQLAELLTVKQIKTLSAWLAV